MSQITTIDADGKILGRLASGIAMRIMGKMSPDYAPNIKKDIKVRVINVSKIRLTGKKSDKKVYKSFSGYPSGLKSVKYSDIISKNPEFILKKAVERMLPKNKLRKNFLKNLILIP